MLYIRKAEARDLSKVVQLSQKLYEQIAKDRNFFSFDGVKKEEIESVLQASDSSVVIIAEGEHNNVYGYLILQQPNAQEEYSFMKDFPNDYNEGEGIIVRSIGVAPTCRKIGLATMMLKTGAYYAVKQGYTKFMGYIYPYDFAIKQLLSKIANPKKSGFYLYETGSDGSEKIRQRFIQDLT